MRAYHLESPASGGLTLSDHAAPSPGADEVLVKVRASALNFRDLALAQDEGSRPITLGRAPLSDAAGEVMAVGAGVQRFRIGDRVVNSFFPNWFGGAFNAMPEQWVTDRDGWLCEQKVVGAEALVAMPDHLSFEEAATLPCAGVTAWSALAGVGPGDTVLTQGAGGVSLFAVQLAKLLGARVIATTSSPAKAKRLRELGADEVIDYRQTPAWADQVRDLTGGRGVDRVVEIGGPASLAQSIEAVAYGGQISLVGVLGGEEGGVDFLGLFASHARLQPIAIGSRRDLEDMIRVVARHTMRPVIDRVFDFDDAKQAFAYFAGRDLFGKVVIRHPA